MDRVDLLRVEQESRRMNLGKPAPDCRVLILSSFDVWAFSGPRSPEGWSFKEHASRCVMSSLSGQLTWCLARVGLIKTAQAYPTRWRGCFHPKKRLDVSVNDTRHLFPSCPRRLLSCAYHLTRLGGSEAQGQALFSRLLHTVILAGWLHHHPYESWNFTMDQLFYHLFKFQNLLLCGRLKSSFKYHSRLLAHQWWTFFPSISQSK